eukprot:PhF_6_TR34418/c0_g1_i1/m.50296
MQFQRQMMRNRVSKRFGRFPGTHGDGYTPAFFPTFIQPTFFGPPWYKPKDAWQELLFVGFVVVPWMIYACWFNYMWYVQRVFTPGRGPHIYREFLAFTDMDDPDYWIKKAEMIREDQAGELNCAWGGTNFMASYLWQPGDPEPDKRRKEPPPGSH